MEGFELRVLDRGDGGIVKHGTSGVFDSLKEAEVQAKLAEDVIQAAMRTRRENLQKSRDPRAVDIIPEDHVVFVACPNGMMQRGGELLPDPFGNKERPEGKGYSTYY